MSTILIITTVTPESYSERYTALSMRVAILACDPFQYTACALYGDDATAVDYATHTHDADTMVSTAIAISEGA